jgi:hypothetical protein
VRLTGVTAGAPGASDTGVERMLLYEMVIATGIAVVLVLTAIGGLIARLMMRPEETALLREAREMPADMGALKRRIAVRSHER